MVRSKRMIVTLSDIDRRWLENYSRVRGISIAEAIRQGIGRLRNSEEPNTYCTIIQQTTGLWKKADGLEYQRQLRAEWDSR